MPDSKTAETCGQAGPQPLVEGQLWPSPDYDAQLERLRAAVGRRIYLVELIPNAVGLAVSMPGQPVVLLDVLAFPRPDPERGLAPHMLLLDDGRGVNLGRVARVSVDRPFDPDPEQLIYRDRDAVDGLLFAERRLSKQLTADRSRALLGQILGKAALPAGSETPAMPRTAGRDGKTE